MCDFRFVRCGMLAKSPGFTLVVVVFFALSRHWHHNVDLQCVRYGLLLRPLPVRHPEELVRMVQKRAQGSYDKQSLPPPTIRLCEIIRRHFIGRFRRGAIGTLL